MKTNFWKEKWKAGEIGFHRDAYNPNLLKWWHRVEAEKHDVVLVPCVERHWTFVGWRGKPCGDWC